MKREVKAIIVLIAELIIGFIILLSMGIISLSGETDAASDAELSPAICYVQYKGKYINVNKNKIAVSVGEEKTEGLPRIMSFKYFTLAENEKVEVKDEEALDYAIAIALCLSSNRISAEIIEIDENKNAYIYVNSLTISLGKNDGTAEKIKSLSGFFDEVKNYNGTLIMESLSKNNEGYIFRASSGETERAEDLPGDTIIISD